VSGLLGGGADALVPAGNSRMARRDDRLASEVAEEQRNVIQLTPYQQQAAPGDPPRTAWNRLPRAK
jgi:hypothetical protein